MTSPTKYLSSGIMFILAIAMVGRSVSAAPGDRIGPSSKPALEIAKEDECGVNGKKPCTEPGDTSELKPEKGSPKKKIVKKAGAAAAAGIAGKKISDNISEKITPGDMEE